MPGSIGKTCSETIVVSARELCRKAAVVLNALEREGCAILVTRYGRAAALLTPIEGSGGTAKLPRPFRRLQDLDPSPGANGEGTGEGTGESAEGQPVDDTLEIAGQLEPLEREALRALIERRLASWVPAVPDEHRWSMRAGALLELEARGLIQGAFPAGHAITRQGARVAAALAGDAASDPASDPASRIP